MSYFPDISDSSAVFTEFTAVSQTLNDQVVTWTTTPRSTGSTGVTIDVSGNITLNGGASYWLILSMDVTRDSITEDVYFRWYDQSDQVISSTAGASQLLFNRPNAPTPNSVGFYAADVLVGGERTIYVKYTSTVDATIESTMTLLCIELKR